MRGFDEQVALGDRGSRLGMLLLDGASAQGLESLASFREGPYMSQPPKTFDELTVPEQILHVQELWDRIAAHAEQVPVTEAQRAELQRRLAAHHADPAAGRSWEDVREALRAKRPSDVRDGATGGQPDAAAAFASIGAWQGESGAELTRELAVAREHGGRRIPLARTPLSPTGTLPMNRRQLIERIQALSDSDVARVAPYIQADLDAIRQLDDLRSEVARARESAASEPRLEDEQAVEAVRRRLSRET